MPAYTCANQQPILSRQVLQNLAKLRFHAFSCQASGLIQQLQERPPLQGQHAQVGENLLLPNPRVQGVRPELVAFLGPGFNDRLWEDWWIGHGGCSRWSRREVVHGSTAESR